MRREGTKCTGATCDADILFVRAKRKDGTLSPKPWPLNPEPAEPTEEELATGKWRGLFVFIDRKALVPVVRTATPDDPPPYYTAHHATCPDVGSFR